MFFFVAWLYQELIIDYIIEGVGLPINSLLVQKILVIVYIMCELFMIQKPSVQTSMQKLRTKILISILTFLTHSS